MSQLNRDFADKLIGLGMGSPLTWARLLRGDSPHELRLNAGEVLGAFKLDAVPAREWTEQLDGALRLHQAAGEVARNWVEQTAEISCLQVSVDRAQDAKRARHEAVVHKLAHAATPQVLAAPAVWRGRLYTRSEAARDPQAREKAEKQERKRYGEKVVGLLVEALLPFGRGPAQRLAAGL